MMRASMLAGLAVIAVLAVAGTAHAQVDPARTRDAMEDYFTGEKQGGYVLVGFGVGGLVAGGLLYRSSSRTGRGAAYPLLGMGALHLAAGIYINVASSGRIDSFGEQIDQDAAAFVTAERARMAGVSTQFTVLKIVEVIVIAGGLTMAIIGKRTARPRLHGAGLALALEAALTLGFDINAAGRAGRYRDELAAIDGSVRSGLPRPTVIVLHAGRF